MTRRGTLCKQRGGSSAADHNELISSTSISVCVCATLDRPQKIVWHGSAANGERAMDTYCDAWHSAAAEKSGLASSLLGNKLLDQERYACDNRFVVLCIEVMPEQARRRKKRELPRPHRQQQNHKQQQQQQHDYR